MKILSATIANYRVLERFSSSFADRLTLVTAPNEAGKSTLAEALHRALFMRHRTGGGKLAAMRSLSGGHPEVELRFSAGGQTWRLRKSFRGAGGSCILERESPPQQWTGDAAEDQLAQLLGVPANVAGGAALERWEHLWVTQGTASADPLASAPGREELLQALASGQGTAAMLGADDRELIAALRQEVGDCFKANLDGFRIDSLPGRLQAELGKARDHLADTTAALATHEARIDDLRRAAALEADTAAALAQRRPAFAALEKEVEAVLELGRRLETETTALAAADKQATALAEEVARLASDRLKAAGIGARLQQAQQKAAEGATRMQALRTLVGHAAKDLQAAKDAAEKAGSLAALAEKQAQVLGLDRQHAELEKRRERRQALVALCVQFREQLAAIPAITAKNISFLRSLEDAVRTSQAGLAAAATSITWTSGSGPVALSGEALEPGSSRLLTATGELTVGGACISIAPGGGTALDERRAELLAAQRKLTEALDQFGVASSDAAAERLSGRQERATQLKEKEAAAAELADPAPELERLMSERTLLAVHIGTLRARGHAIAEDADVPALQREAERQRTGVTVLEKRVQGCQQEADDFASVLADAEKAVRQLCDEAATMNGRIAVMVQSLGDETAVAQRQEALTAQRQARIEQISGIKDTLGHRDPSLLKRKRDLEGQSLGSLQTAHDKAEAEAMVLRRDLEHLPKDLAAEQEEASAAVERLERSSAEAALHAKGARHLLQCLDAAARQLQDDQERPFLQAVSRYLHCFFGSAGAVGLDGEGQERRLAAVDRTAGELGSFTFESLSVGAREQVAVAVRLAMAEVIAAKRADRSLPAILDDAFANSDPHRQANLGLMLAEACDHGLQVVLLTCDDRMGHLGEQQVIRLDRPRHRAAAMTAPAAVAVTAATGVEDGPGEGDGTAIPGPGPEAVPAPPASDGDDQAAFLAAMPSSEDISSRALRSQLVWDQERFDRIRDALVAAGRVIQPPGTRSLRKVQTGSPPSPAAAAGP